MNLMPDFTFPKTRRLLKAAEFDRVFHRRRSQSDSLVVVYACENDLPHTRLGLVVSRKCGNAVVRNRWKRCLREAFRLAQQELPAGLDLVVLPRKGAASATPRLRQSLLMLAERLSRQLKKSPPALPAAKPIDEAAP
jgi:ribonuclease P protein component